MPAAPLDYYSPSETRPLDRISLLSFLSALLLFIPFLPAIAAIFLGRAGLRRTTDPNLRGRGLARAGYYLGIAAVIVWTLLTPVIVMATIRAREAALRAHCASNLRQVGLAVFMYATESNGRFPTDLSEVVIGGYVRGTTIFTCPAAEIPPSSGLSYTYLGRGLKIQELKNAGQYIIAYEDTQNHEHRGMNVLYGDLHVEWHDRPNAQWIVSELAAGTNPPRPMPPGWQPMEE